MVPVKSREAMFSLASSVIQSAYDDLLTLDDQRRIELFLQRTEPMEGRNRKINVQRSAYSKKYNLCQTAMSFFNSEAYMFWADILGIDYLFVYQTYLEKISGEVK
jgi:hypothetical protein